MYFSSCRRRAALLSSLKSNFISPIASGGHCLGGELNRERLELAADRVHLLCVLGAELDDRVPAGLIAHHETIAFQALQRIPDRDAARPDFLRERSLNEPRTTGDLSAQYPVAQQMIDLGAERLPSHSHFLLIAQKQF